MNIKYNLEIIGKKLEIVKVKFLVFTAATGWLWNYMATSNDLLNFYGIINIILLCIFAFRSYIGLYDFFEISLELKKLKHKLDVEKISE